MFMVVLLLCGKCRTVIDHIIVEIISEKIQSEPDRVAVEYCPRCEEYKVGNQRFSRHQEREAVVKQFETHKITSGDFINYKVILPIRESPN